MKALILAITIALTSNANIHIQALQPTQTQQVNLYEYHDIGRWYVEEGDTIEEVAQFYSNNTHDISITMDIIKDLNNLENDNIQGLEFVTVPLFENMGWYYHEEK